MRRRWVAIARGDEPADLVLAGGHVLSVFTGEVFSANVAIAEGHIVGVGDYRGPNEFDVTGKILIPGLIDGHCHIESSKLNVDEFARAVLKHGTTSVVVDPHEMANVLGTAGVEYMLAASKGLPLGVYVMMPSCVPASRFESPAEALEACDFAELLQRQRVIGIAEMMNYPAAIAAAPDVMSKMAITDYRRIDGHAPDVHGRDLNAYIVSGPGSDHECTTLDEALEKKRLGMWIMMREASMIRNLVDLLPLVTEYGTDNCMFVTDDREASTLLTEGHMNSMVRTAVAHGIPTGDAVKLASLNVARYHSLTFQGAVAPGYQADIVVLPDLATFQPDAVFKTGKLVVHNGDVVAFGRSEIPDSVTQTVHVGPIDSSAFRIRSSGSDQVRVIEIVPDQVVTRATVGRVREENGYLLSDPATDILKIAVVERHHATGRVGLGFVRGFGLRSGAFASTVAHDAHNIVVVGTNDRDMASCVDRLKAIGGGLVACQDGDVVGELTLEIAGLMSSLPAETVANHLALLESRLHAMGVKVRTPFMYLGFMALSVIPELRVTDQGLIDVRTFRRVPLSVS
ncbi:MAG TPA: adenine deaminase [Chloroflexota bacterium]